MAEEKEKIVLEREYVIPLRKKFLNTPQYRRVPKAIKALKKFIARHMKLYDGDFEKIKIDKYLNEEIWFQGIRKPPAKIKVKVKKYDSGIVKVELAEIPEKLKWKIEREKKQNEEVEKKVEKKKEEEKKKEAEEKLEGKVEKAEERKEETKDEKEKEKSVIESGIKEAEIKHKEMKHETIEKKIKKQPLARKALQK